MKDKVQKIREEVERLKSQLLRGACSSQITMETSCKEEAYDEVLTLLDTIQEEPIIEDLDKAAKADAKVERSDDTEVGYNLDRYSGFISGAEWRLAQIMKNSADAMIGLPYENKDGGYTHLIDVSRPLPVGNNKIAIIFKEN